MNGFKELCRVIKPYTCTSCGNDLLFFSKPNSAIMIDYKELLTIYDNKQDIIEYLSNRDVKVLKCLACKKMYIIDWSGRLPRPLIYKDDLKKFGYKF